MISPAFVFAAIGLALMYAMWRYRDSPLVSPRAMPWVAAPTAFFLAFGVPFLLDAASGAAYSDSGMTMLLILLVVTFFASVFEGLIAHKFHKVTTTFLCALFGFCVAVTWVDWPQVTHFMVRLPKRVGHSMGKESRHVAATHGHATHSQYVWAVVFAIAVVVAVLIARSRHNSHIEEEGLDPQAVPQPVMDRSLGVGSFFGRLWSARGDRRRQHRLYPPVQGALPLDSPRPAPSGRRNSETGAPAVRN